KGAGGTDKAVAVYQQAKQIFQSFVDKASGKTEYAGAVKKSQERMQDIDDTITFLQAGGPSTGGSAAPDSSDSSAAASSSAPRAGSAAPAAGSASAAPAPAAPANAKPAGKP